MAKRIVRAHAGPNEHYVDAKWTTAKVDKELKVGLALINSVDKPIVTFFGSARTKPTDARYKHCNRLASALAKRGYAVMSGGGPGIMEAANSGAKKAGGTSIGLGAGLIKNEKTDMRNFTGHLRFQFLFVRRFLLAIKSDALLVYPGGFGTLNELFEYVCLMQTGLVERVPIILVDKKYWSGMRTWIDKTILAEGMISPGNQDIIQYVDTVEEALAIVERAKRP